MDADKLLGILDNTYSLTSLAGTGGTAKVYIGYNLNDENKNKLAIKIFKKIFTYCELVQSEIEIQKSLSVRNVVKLISHGKGILQKENGSEKYVAYIVLEYMEYGDLFDFIAMTGRGFGEAMGVRIFSELVKAVDDLHSQNICHRDIKTENIMIDSKFQLKLADFSFATSTLDDPLLTSVCGTHDYNSPELHGYLPYVGSANDIFSLGVALFIIVLGKKPFRSASEDDFLYDLIIQHSYDSYWEKILKNVSTPVSSSFKSLFVTMVANDHSRRPSINDIKDHLWVQETVQPQDHEYFEEFILRARTVEKKRKTESRM
jgi:serine/threonine protein kinase